MPCLEGMIFRLCHSFERTVCKAMPEQQETKLGDSAKNVQNCESSYN